MTTGGWVVYRTTTLTAGVRFIDREGRLVPVEIRVESDGGVGTDTVRSLPLGRFDAIANGEGARVLRQWMDRSDPDLRRRLDPDRPAIPEMKLDVPAGGNYGDDFYRQVARIYRSASVRVRAPAMALAEANGVPVTTARRWIKEARARGFLPAGRAGKAG